MTDLHEQQQDDAFAGTKFRVLSGKWVVVGMISFDILATAVLWTFWKLQTAPFHSLQEAIAVAFPGSLPRVEGGSDKTQPGNPRIVRIVMRVDFDPETHDEQAGRVVDRLMALARRHHDLSTYSSVEIHLFWPEPEKRLHERTIVRPIDAPSQ